MSTFTMNCPNEDCEAEYEVAVTVFGRDLRATRESPAECAEIEVGGPATCPACGEPLDTPSEHASAVDRFRTAMVESELEHRLEALIERRR